MNPGRRWAYGGAALGAAVSIAANVAHSYVPPAGVAAAWRPQPGAVALAIFWPVALLVGIEILARVAWPAGWRWWLARWLGLVPVAAVAAVVSYRHLSGLLAWYGEDGLTVAIGPLAVDGLMVMATGALMVPVSPVTQAVTAPAGAPTVDPVPLTAATLTAVAGVAAARARQPAVTVTVDEAAAAPPGQVPRTVAPPEPGEPTRQAVWALADAEPTLSQRALAGRLGVSDTTVQRALKRGRPAEAAGGA